MGLRKQTMSTTRGRGRTTIVLVVTTLAATHAATAQSTYDTPIQGGPSGSRFTLTCQHNQVLVGITGRYGSWIDQVQGKCKWVDINGNWVGDRTNLVFSTNAFSAGGWGGIGVKTYERWCPTNYAVVGYSVHKGSYVNRLKIRCKRVGSGGLTTGTLSSLSWVMGWAASIRGPYDCKNNWPAQAVIGRAGSYVDAIGLRCARPTIPFGWLTPITTENTNEAINTRLGPNAEDLIANHNIRQIVTDANVKVRADNLACQSCHTGPGTPGNFNAATISRTGFCAQVPAFDRANKPTILKRLFNHWRSRTCPD